MDELSVFSKENDESDKKKEARSKLEDKLYDECHETKMVEVGNGFVTYCRHFKYLGSWISHNLRDDHDVDMRIAAAGRSMGALNHFFGRNEVNIYSKYLIFMAIPINLLLWGCESWALRVDLSRKLERFVNRKIRKIININLWHVMKHRITVEEMRNRFNNIPSVQTMIDIRTMQFLGKIVRDQCPYHQGNY